MEDLKLIFFNHIQEPRYFLLIDPQRDNLFELLDRLDGRLFYDFDNHVVASVLAMILVSLFYVRGLLSDALQGELLRVESFQKPFKFVLEHNFFKM